MESSSLYLDKLVFYKVLEHYTTTYVVHKNIVKVLGGVTVNGVWISNRIYCTLTTRNYK
jgi:hypothetical protein